MSRQKHARSDINLPIALFFSVFILLLSGSASLGQELPVASTSSQSAPALEPEACEEELGLPSVVLLADAFPIEPLPICSERGDAAAAPACNCVCTSHTCTQGFPWTTGAGNCRIDSNTCACKAGTTCSCACYAQAGGQGQKYSGTTTSGIACTTQ